MVRFFCPGCWKDFARDHHHCPACGLDIHGFWESLDRVEKLALALHHPEPSTPIRAAWLLGKTKDPRAVQALIKLFQETTDVFIAIAAVQALGEIGTPEAATFLKSLATHPAATIRHAAERIQRAADREAGGDA